MPSAQALPDPPNAGSPAWQKRFDGSSDEYLLWRTSRLKRLAMTLESTNSDRFLPLATGARRETTESVQARICDAVAQDGHALYQWQPEPENVEEQLAHIHRSLGLELNDSGVITEASEFSVLQDSTGTPRARFIPYSNKAMNWHTDGYYNEENAQVRCFTLHCVAPAAEGGALSLLDPELLLIALYDDDPELVRQLAHPQAMTLPANSDAEGHDRPDRVVPMLFQQADGSLGARFTTRLTNITWRCENTQAAVLRANELIDQHRDWQTVVKLDRGQGVITRNVLHCREAFRDAPGSEKRRILRGRYLQLPTPTH